MAARSFVGGRRAGLRQTWPPAPGISAAALGAGLRRVSIGVWVGVASAAAACVPPVTGEFTCATDADCALGNRCSPSGHTCEATPRGISLAGAPCLLDVDCEDWACLAAWPGGMCSKVCLDDGDCAGAAGEGNDAHCAAVAGSDRHYCLLDCDDDGVCRAPDYGCVDVDRDVRRECHPIANGDGLVGDPCNFVSDCAGGNLGTCLTGWPDGYCARLGCPSAPCTAGTHCQFADLAGQCVLDCGDADDCRASGYDCYDFDLDGTPECAPIGAGVGPLGAACGRLDDCGGGRFAICLIGADWPGGLCSIGGCGVASVCPSDSHCGYSDPEIGGICFPDCVGDLACRHPSYGCYDADHDDTNECARLGSGSSPIGGPCEETPDCGGGTFALCVPPSSATPGGYCTKECGGEAGGCPAGSVCPVAGSGYCQASCEDVGDCRPGYECVLGATGDLVCDTI